MDNLEEEENKPKEQKYSFNVYVWQNWLHLGLIIAYFVLRIISSIIPCIDEWTEGILTFGIFIAVVLWNLVISTKCAGKPNPTKCQGKFRNCCAGTCYVILTLIALLGFSFYNWARLSTKAKQSLDKDENLKTDGNITDDAQTFCEIVHFYPIFYFLVDLGTFAGLTILVMKGVRIILIKILEKEETIKKICQWIFTTLYVLLTLATIALIPYFIHHFGYEHNPKLMITLTVYVALRVLLLPLGLTKRMLSRVLYVEAFLVAVFSAVVIYMLIVDFISQRPSHNLNQLSTGNSTEVEKKSVGEHVVTYWNHLSEKPQDLVFGQDMAAWGILTILQFAYLISTILASLKAISKQGVAVAPVFGLSVLPLALTTALAVAPAMLILYCCSKMECEGGGSPYNPNRPAMHPYPQSQSSWNYPAPQPRPWNGGHPWWINGR